MKPQVLVIGILLGLSLPSLAQKRKKVATAPTAEVPARPQPAPDSSPLPPTTSPVLAQLARDWTNDVKLMPAARSWLIALLEGRNEQAVRTWPETRKIIPPSAAAAGEIGYLTALWNLGLRHSFLNSYVDLLAAGSLGDGKAHRLFERELAPAVKSWLEEEATFLSPAMQALVLKTRGDRSLLTPLRDWALVSRDREPSSESNFYPWYLLREMSESLAANQPEAAEKLLRTRLNPWVEAHPQSGWTERRDLLWGRVLYQQGAWARAVEVYEKVPKTSPQFIAAREELGWALLQTGDFARARGEAASLTNAALEFSPESHVLQAVTDIQMCHYDRAAEGLRDFLRAGTPWAKRIEQALQEKDVPAPPDESPLATRTARALAGLEREIALAKGTKLEVTLLEKLRESTAERLRRDRERAWRNHRELFAEAIRKMRFVRLEILGQQQGFLAADVAPNEPREATKNPKKYDYVFPVEGDLWADEFFQVRSRLTTRCTPDSETTGVE